MASTYSPSKGREGWSGWELSPVGAVASVRASRWARFTRASASNPPQFWHQALQGANARVQAVLGGVWERIRGLWKPVCGPKAAATAPTGWEAPACSRRGKGLGQTVSLGPWGCSGSQFLPF